MADPNFSGTATPYTTDGDQKIYKAPNGREYPVIEYRQHMESYVVMPAGWGWQKWCEATYGKRQCSLCNSGRAHLCHDYQREVDKKKAQPNQ